MKNQYFGLRNQFFGLSKENLVIGEIGYFFREIGIDQQLITIYFCVIRFIQQLRYKRINKRRIAIEFKINRKRFKTKDDEKDN
jgi:hypothetical protein